MSRQFQKRPELKQTRQYLFPEESDYNVNYVGRLKMSQQQADGTLKRQPTR